MGKNISPTQSAEIRVIYAACFLRALFSCVGAISATRNKTSAYGLIALCLRKLMLCDRDIISISGDLDVQLFNLRDLHRISIMQGGVQSWNSYRD